MANQMLAKRREMSFDQADQGSSGWIATDHGKESDRNIETESDPDEDHRTDHVRVNACDVLLIWCRTLARMTCS